MYSARAGTRAAGFDAQVPAEIKKQRSRELHELGRAMHADWLQKQIGAESRVLWEQENDNGAWTCYTDNFIHVLADEKNAESLENKITPVRIVAVDGDHCVVRVCPASVGIGFFLDLSEYSLVEDNMTQQIRRKFTPQEQVAILR